jgi:hypothetical protein
MANVRNALFAFVVIVSLATVACQPLDAPAGPAAAQR